METNTVEVDNIQSFFQSFIDKQQGNTNEQAASTSTNEDNTKLENKEENKDGDGSNSSQTNSKEFLENLKKKEEEGNKEGVIDLSDIGKISEQLAKDNLLFKFEDDTLPSNYEELKMALEQSDEARAKAVIDQAWNSRVENLSPSMKMIHHYADTGVVSAQEVEQFISKVSYSEQIAALDIKKPEDQEKIITIQLLVNGMDEETAREQVSEYKALNKLESYASKFYPSLKRKADEQILSEQKVAEQKKADLDGYLQNNAQYVAHYIEDGTDVLPFKVVDDKYKRAIFSVAAQPLSVRDDGDVVFGWEVYIKNKQNGQTEEDFKEYMDIMAFIANRKLYKESLGKIISNDNKTTNYKKIKAAEQSDRREGDGSYREDNIRIKKSTALDSPWTIK